MKVVMLANVCPADYGIPGQPGWGAVVKWEKGKEYNLDSDFAEVLVENGDAKYKEES